MSDIKVYFIYPKMYFTYLIYPHLFFYLSLEYFNTLKRILYIRKVVIDLEMILNKHRQIIFGGSGCPEWIWFTDPVDCMSPCPDLTRSIDDLPRVPQDDWPDLNSLRAPRLIAIQLVNIGYPKLPSSHSVYTKLYWSIIFVH